MARQSKSAGRQNGAVQAATVDVTAAPEKTEVIEVAGVPDEAAAVRELVIEEESWPLERYESEGGFDWLNITNIWLVVVLGFIEVFLSFRLGFRLAAANPDNGFVSIIYSVTKPLISPFEGIVQDSRLGSAGVFEPSIMVAMLVYIVGAILLMSIAWAIAATAGEARQPPELSSRGART